MRRTRFSVLPLAFVLLLSGGCGTAGESAEPAAQATLTPTAVVSEPSMPAEAAAAEPSVTAVTDTAEPSAEASPAEASVSAVPASASVSTSEPLPEVTEDPALTCSLWVRCDTILDHLDELDAEKAELVPEDGVLLCAEDISFDAGESAFDVLLRVTREKKLHLEFVDTPLFKSSYIEGICNIYEFDCGELSGWSYKVNGVFPGYGCSLCQLNDGDVVEWVYTCDLGKDVGGSNGWEDGT